MVHTKLHTGAKFDEAGRAGYNTSGGLNGVGSKATNALSEYFTVVSTRDGKRATASFIKGKLQEYTEIESNSKTTGTYVKFKPDAVIFTEGITLDYDDIRNQLKELAYLSPGLRFTFTYKDKETEIIESKEGIKDYIKELNANKATLTSVFYTETVEDRIGVKIAMQYNDTYSDTYRLFTNSIPNSGGTHLTGFRIALTQCINRYAREAGLLKEKDENITGEELKEGLTLVLSFIMEGRTIVQKLVSKNIEEWLETNKSDAKAIVDKALLARAAREKAKQAKETVRKQVTGRRIMMPDILADASGKNRKDCEVFIVEGKSAAGSTKEARDRTTQAVFQLRGRSHLPLYL